MKQKRLSKKEIKEINKQVEQRFAISEFFDKKDKVELIDEQIITLNDESSFFYHENKLIPTLKLIMKNNFLKKVVVDMPAVPFMVKGADVMRPGITDLEEFKKGDYVVVVDETHNKPLAIGQALFSSKEIQDMEKGKVIENLHWVGDKIWNTKI